MLATIIRGRIRITFPDELIGDELAEQQEAIAASIGSACLFGKQSREMSCAVSHNNFRKLRQLGCRLSPDRVTRKVVASLRSKLDLYEEESERGAEAKNGTIIHNGYEFKKPPFAHQKIGFQFLHSMPNPALFGDCGTGKGLPLSSRVLTPSGWIEIGSIEVGSFVIGGDGRSYPVEGVYDQGEQDLFEVSFSDGTRTICDGSHLWSVKSHNDIARGRPWRVLSTEELTRTNLKFGKRRQSRTWRIPMVSPPSFDKKELPISPYVLGVLLGDGCLLTSTPRWTKSDIEIAERVKFLIEDDLVISKLSSKDRSQSWSIRKATPGPERSSISKSLESLGLLGCKSEDKFVPEDYLFSSPDERIELLRGLLDTDGSGGRYVEFSSSSERLARDVVTLVQSLGGTANANQRLTSYTYDGVVKEGLPSWRVHLSMPSHISPFHLERKKLKGKRLEPRRCIDSIAPMGKGVTRCIRIASPDRTFVVEDFVVTHNTFMVSTYADSLTKAGRKIAFLVVCPVNLIQHVWLEDTATFTDLKVISLRVDSTVYTIGEDWDDKKDGELGFRERAALRAARKEDPAWKKKAKRKAQARVRKKIDARFAESADMYVINPENLRTDAKEKRVLNLCKRLKAEGFEICLIIDESSKLKSRTSRTYRSLKRVRSFASSCIIMTGTPSPNGILDLWAQFDILDDGMTLQPSFKDYRFEVAKEKALRGVTYQRGGQEHNVVVWQQRPGAAQRVYATISPRMIRFRTEDCVDLPPQRFIMRYVEMTADQEAFYKDMEERLFAEIDGEPVTAKVAVAKIVKLRAVTGGFVRTDEGEDKPFNKDAAKMLELDELLEQSIGRKLGDEGPPLKAIIWAQYQWECKTLIQRYKEKYGARGLFGGISAGAKNKNITAFKNTKSCRLLVCHPGAAGHGLTLTEANYAFYYSMSHNFEEFYQSYRRITRPGQTRAMTTYFLIAPNTIDEELIDAIRSKKNLSDIITDGKFDRKGFFENRGKLGGQLSMDWDVSGEDQS